MKKNSFTLIELLVVVAIIAVLVAILLPAMSGARERTKRVVCAGRLMQLHRGLVFYADDYGLYPAGRRDCPWASTDYPDPTYPPEAPGLPRGIWPIMPYLLGAKASWTLSGATQYESEQVKRYFICPSAHVVWWSLGSSKANYPYWYFAWIDFDAWLGAIGEESNIHEIVRKPDSPPDLRLLMDNAYEFLAVAPDSTAFANHTNGIVEGANQLFNDGHVAWRSKEDMTLHRYPGLWGTVDEVYW